MNQDNLSEYQDPVTYDSEYGSLGLDWVHYEGLARSIGDPILELACGTGRMTIPLAERGYRISGVDITPEMLERAMGKSAGKGLSIEWHLADCQTLELKQTYRFIFMTGNAFQAFLDRDAQDNLMRSVCRHLERGGVFAFETRNPIPAHLEDFHEATEDGHYLDERGFKVTVSSKQWYDKDTQIQHCTTLRRWQDKEGVFHQRESRIDLRYTYPVELEALLRSHGLSLVQQYGSFDHSPYQADSPLMVCVCKKSEP